MRTLRNRAVLVWSLLSRRAIAAYQRRIRLNPYCSWSGSGRPWNTALDRGYGGWFPVPNLSGGYHGILRQWWEHYGLGNLALLVSENTRVGSVFANRYPETQFVTTDYFPELTSPHQDGTGGCDVIWNLYEEPPAQLQPHSFNSIVCQATVEHLHDPVGVLRRLAGLQSSGGRLYLHSHTPGFEYHGFPNDYLRYWPEWFRDMPLSIPSYSLDELLCLGGHAFAVYQRRVGAS